jgi:hypothetical protein
MAIYKNAKEKEEIRKAFKVFLAQNDVKLKHLCERNNLEYNKEYNKLFLGNVNSEDVDRLSKLIDSKAKLNVIAGRFLVNRAL